MSILTKTLCVAMALVIPTQIAAQCQNLTEADQIEILALNIYHEARGESPDAQQMVGEVVLNRVASPEFPNTICEVIYAEGQFSWTTMEDSTPYEKEAWEQSLQIAEDLVFADISYFNNGATYYLNPTKVSSIPRWARTFVQVGKIDSHVFYINPAYNIASLLE